jgi:RND superfamily putative drug exporter
MRRPVAVLLLTLVGLSVFAAPIKDIAFGQVDSQVLPKDHPAAVAARVADERFPGRESVPVEFVVENGAKFLGSAELMKYQEAISATDGILYLTDAVTSGELLRFNAIHSMSPRSLPAEALIDKLRKIPAPDGTLIGGAAADYTDTQQGIADALPWALLWISVSVLLLLFVFTGSILLPIKAVLLNILSLAATLGVVTWIFIDGNLANLLGGFTVTGTLDTGSVILIAVTTFGLSMDYEVFLLSRIKEEYEAGKSNSDAVAIGLQKSARIITAAAFVLAVVFGAFILGGVASIKMLGFGVAFAILIDATIVRGLLVPALMRLFGAANWWAPKGLKRFTISH